jgi:tetratricopeptide (TPR) repeat protein
MARKKSKPSTKQATVENKPESPSRDSASYRQYLPYLILFLASFLVYANTIGHGYAVDDFIIIQENAYVKEGLSGIGKIMTSDAFEGHYGERGKNLVAGGRYRPLSIVTFAIEYQLMGGLNPQVSHFINVLFFALSVLAVFLVLKKLIPPKKGAVFVSVAFAASLLYALHPIHTEAVANIKGRDEIMGFGFAILSFWYLLKFKDENKNAHLVLSVLFYGLALFSKENAITFLAVMPFGLYILKKESIIDSLKPIIPHVALAGVFLFLRHTYAGSGEGIFELMNNPFLFSSGSEKYGTILLTYLEYGRLLIFPKVLSHDYYPFQVPVTSLTDFRAILSLVLVLGILGGFLYLAIKKKFPVVAFGLGYFLFTFSVGSNLFFQIGTNMNERFLYMPSLGFAILLAWAVLHFSERYPMGKAGKAPLSFVLILILISLGYSAKTFDRNQDWKNNLTLFEADVQNSPNSAKVHLSYANSLVKYVTENINQPKPVKDSVLNIAISNLYRAVEIYPDTTVVVNGKPRYVSYADAWACMGDAYYLKERFDSAEIAYLNAHKARDKHFNAFVGLSLTMLNTEQYHRAVYYLRSVLTVASDNHLHWARLGNAYFQLGLQWKQQNENLAMTGADSAQYYSALSIEAYQQAASLFQEGNADYLYEIGRNYARLRDDFPAAIDYFKQSLAFNPNLVPAREDLGICLMLSGQFVEAETQFQALLNKDPNYTNARLNLGYTQLEAAFKKLESGDQAGAQSYAQKAIDTYTPVSPEQPQAFLQSRLGMGRAAAEIFHDFASANQFFAQALEIDPNIGSSISSFAQAAMSRNDQQALSYYMNMLSAPNP